MTRNLRTEHMYVTCPVCDSAWLEQRLWITVAKDDYRNIPPGGIVRATDAMYRLVCTQCGAALPYAEMDDALVKDVDGDE